MEKLSSKELDNKISRAIGEFGVKFQIPDTIEELLSEEN